MNGRIIEIICSYRRQDIDPDRIEIVPDEQIVDLYAARVTGLSDYLVHAEDGSVEEVAFETWPPRETRSDAGGARPEARGGLRVEQVMSSPVRYCSTEDTLETAARSMWDYDCGCVPVCAGEGEGAEPPRVVGMLTDRDVCMSALFQGQRLAEVPVSAAMSRGVCACRAGDTVADVERVMRERRLRRVPVVDENGGLIGIVSLADLARRGTRDARGVTEAAIGETLSAIVEPGPSTAAA